MIEDYLVTCLIRHTRSAFCDQLVCTCKIIGSNVSITLILV